MTLLTKNYLKLQLMYDKTFKDYSKLKCPRESDDHDAEK